jgi:hypothetical protein
MPAVKAAGALFSTPSLKSDAKRVDETRKTAPDFGY